MGARQFSAIESQQLKQGEWAEVLVKDMNFGRCKTLRSYRTGAMIDEYQLSWTNENDYLHYLISFNWRNRKHTNAPIVNSVFLKQISKREICSGKYAANIYLEHIAIRFSQIEEVPISDTLYILLEAIDGYQQLYNHSGYFRVQQEQICFDLSGKIKVWVNANLAKNYPNHENESNIASKDETNMVQQLIDMVVLNTDPDEQPQMSLIQHFSRIRALQKHQIGFECAKVVILEYAKKYQLRISMRLQTIDQLCKNPDIPTNVGSFQSYPHQQRIPFSQNYSRYPRQQHFAEPLPSPNIIYYQQMPNFNANAYHPVLYSPIPHNFVSIPPYQIYQQNPFAQKKDSQTVPTEKPGYTNNTKSNSMSRFSKSHAINPLETTQNQSQPFIDQQTDEHNTMRSMPMRGHSLDQNRSACKQRVLYSQYIEDVYSQNEYENQINPDSFGLANQVRRRLKESSGSYKIVSSSSSKKQSYNRRSSSFKGSEKFSGKISKQSSVRERQSQKKWSEWNTQFYTLQCNQQYELDPQIEADIRKYLG